MLDAGELPFPEDVERYHGEPSGLIWRLRLERDRIASGLPSPASEPASSAPASTQSLTRQESGDSTAVGIADKAYLTAKEVSSYTGIPLSGICKMTHFR